MIKLVEPYYLECIPLNYNLMYKGDDQVKYRCIAHNTTLRALLNSIIYHAGVNTPPEIKSIEGLVNRLEGIVLKASDNEVIERLMKQQEGMATKIMKLNGQLRAAKSKFKKMEGNND